MADKDCCTDNKPVFGSVCSGIEAASVAWHPLGWKAAWLAEIEPFPCAVLAHHYPDTPNYGDMTALPARILAGDVQAPDVFCGGTPCQAFSIAGLRRSLEDARGNLSLTFCEIADAIDTVRSANGEQPAVIFWENVPGVLSTADNAFGCFLAGLAGEDVPLEPPRGKWTNAGVVVGPARTVAWRVLDAQYFGLAQRRRRVFVVASARDGFDPVEVLLEFDGVRRDSPPSREAREGAAGGFARSVALRGREGGATAELGDDLQNRLRASSGGGDKPHVITMAHGQGGAEIASDRSPAITCNHEAPIAVYSIQAGALRINPSSGPDGVGVQEGHAYTLEARAEVQAVCVTGKVTHTLKAEGFDASEDGTGRGQPIVVHGTQDPCHDDHVAFALGRNSGQENVIAFNPNQEGMGLSSEFTPPIGASTGGGNQNCIAFSCKDHGADAGQVSPTLRSMGHDGSHANAGGQVAVVQYSEHETLYNKGFNTLKEGNASTQKTYPGTILRTLREEVGEEAFAKWGLGILDSLQQKEVLRQALHGISIRPASFSRSWVVCCALGFPVYGSGWLLQSLREAGCERCPSQGWEPSEQLAGELGAYLSELSQPGAQAARFMRDLWFASEGLGLLRQALSAVQKMGRPSSRKGQSILGSSEGRGEESAENVLSSGVQCEISREGVLHETCAAGEARDSREGIYEQERSGKGRVGETPFAVRRITVEECEFLQGFPRGYSQIPWRKKPASDCPDGPRYKALGNSWAVPCVRWIGKRIDQEIKRSQK